RPIGPPGRKKVRRKLIGRKRGVGNKPRASPPRSTGSRLEPGFDRSIEPRAHRYQALYGLNIPPVFPGPTRCRTRRNIRRLNPNKPRNTEPRKPSLRLPKEFSTPFLFPGKKPLKRP